ncbi:MAG: UDP-N-acetylmuramoyl-L-alanyl-D-glutamate--2,6-diaminopimelate ligase [Nitrospinae bacterium]|nr:UDP-N-acetylmuramoyl-L-alanyl-D-glutamate--2,6-diaminopimelate ligase [Nitrospinota bacterium]
MGHTLLNLIDGYPMADINGTLDRNIESIAYDSRKVEPEALFVAMPGHHHDGSRFIGQAVEKQAAAFVTEVSKADMAKTGLKSPGVTAIHVDDSRHVLAWLSDRFYGRPSDRLDLIGITGTNGKTTLTYILEKIFETAGHSCGVIGTINYRYGGNEYPAPMTTPEALEINRMLHEMAGKGVEKCCIEVSSHSLTLKRVRELRFAVGVFTNLTRDHLDYHKTFEHYKDSKKILFRDCKIKNQVINIDDPVGQEIVQESSIETLTTGLDSRADVTAEDCVLLEDGIRFTLKTPSGTQAISSPLLGRHNVHNLLSASAVALAQGISLAHIAQGIQSLERVPGRFEKIQQGQNFIVAVDYAHTDDALANALKVARTLSKNRVIVVFGCGGDRDPGKRKEMGRVALEMSDFTVITSDNPRTEDPEQIIQHICEGIPAGRKPKEHYTILPNRREAIDFAIKKAQTGDLVLIAGKGHEDYQILKSGKIHFDDREEAVRALRIRLGVG